ncbi:MAG: lipocalin family protein, partial [Terrimicrobiaceae bacterium]
MKTALVLATLALAACSTAPKLPPLRTVDHVDLGRFMGDWYVIGTIPWIVEKNNVGTMDIYKLRPDGKIDITYAFHKKSLDAPRREMKAVARVVNTRTNAEWRVQFLWPFEAPFLVIDLSPDYRFTTIG